MKHSLILLIYLLSIIFLSGCGKSTNQDYSQTKNSPNISSDPATTWTEWTEVVNDEQKLNELQSQVDEGHRVGLLIPVDVAALYVSENLRGILTSNGKYRNISEKDDPEFGKIVSYHFENGCVLEIKLNQPVKQGMTGMWTVQGYRTNGYCK
jgi:hypothetical protein